MASSEVISTRPATKTIQYTTTATVQYPLPTKANYTAAHINTTGTFTPARTSSIKSSCSVVPIGPYNSTQNYCAVLGSSQHDEAMVNCCGGNAVMLSDDHCTEFCVLPEQYFNNSYSVAANVNNFTQCLKNQYSNTANNATFVVSKNVTAKNFEAYCYLPALDGLKVAGGIDSITGGAEATMMSNGLMGLGALAACVFAGMSLL